MGDEQEAARSQSRHTGSEVAGLITQVSQVQMLPPKKSNSPKYLTDDLLSAIQAFVSADATSDSQIISRFFLAPRSWPP